METYMSISELDGIHYPSARQLVVTTSIAMLLLLVGGIWSPAMGGGPALWIATPQQAPGPPGAVGGVIELRPFQMRTSGTPKQITITKGTLNLSVASGIAFQPNGAMWVCTLNNKLLKFGPDQLNNLAAVPLPTPKVVISSDQFGFNIGCFVTPGGELWVVDSNHNAVHKFTHAQLVQATLTGGRVTMDPAVTITDDVDLASPAFATQDASGNLWISSFSNNKLVAFFAGQLGSSGSPAPAVIISSPSLNGPGQSAFDPFGNLWVTNALNNTVVKFVPSQLFATGSPTAAAVIGDDGSGSLVTPWGCAFDDLGRLWVFNYGTATTNPTTISMFGLSQLVATGATSPTPRIVLSGLPPFAAQITFGSRY